MQGDKNREGSLGERFRLGLITTYYADKEGIITIFIWIYKNTEEMIKYVMQVCNVTDEIEIVIPWIILWQETILRLQ